MNTKTETKSVSMLQEFVSAVKVSLRDAAKAAKSDATAGQKGAWYIACQFESGKTIDESLAEMRGALKKAKLPTGKIESARKIVGHAIALRKSQKDDSFPDAQWHSVKYYARIEDITNKTSSGIAGTWSVDHSNALNKIKDSKGIPFVKSYCQKFDIGKDQMGEVDVRSWDRDFLAMSKPAASEATAEATSEQLVLALVKRGEVLKVALARLSQGDRSALMGVIEVVNQEQG
jgi:hypothetical protein|tara:strand:- start:2147 stop:2842 length:696 start_codon:yes stop_codon:yes gene_type:complete